MDKIAEAIETLDNLIGSLAMPIPDNFTVQAMRVHLPEIRQKLHDDYVLVTGDDPWAS